MTDTMIERISTIADAADDAAYLASSPEGRVGLDTSKLARDILTAMREPTEAMKDAQVPNSTDFGSGDPHEAVWRTMIDAALTEGSWS